MRIRLADLLWQQGVHRHAHATVNLPVVAEYKAHPLLFGSKLIIGMLHLRPGTPSKLTVEMTRA